MSNGEVLNKLAGIIPQGYFDLIARVLPGFVLLAITHWVFTGNLIPLSGADAELNAGSFLFFTAVIVFSYSIGLVLNTLGPVLVVLDATWQWLPLAVFHAEFKDQFIEDNSLDRRLYLPWRLREFRECMERKARSADSNARPMHAKMRGEMAFCNSLALGCAILLVIIGRLGLPDTAPEHVDGVLWSILVFATVSAGYRSWRLMMRFQRYLMSDK